MRIRARARKREKIRARARERERERIRAWVTMEVPREGVSDVGGNHNTEKARVTTTTVRRNETSNGGKEGRAEPPFA